MTAFGSFGFPDAAASGDQDSVSERWRLAGESDVTEEVLIRLAADDDTQVAATVAQNPASSSRVLIEVVRTHPELADLVALNRNASIELKDASPLSEHTEDSVTKYLDDRDATPEQRSRFSKKYRQLRPPGGPTVAEVWAFVVSA